MSSGRTVSVLRLGSSRANHARHSRETGMAAHNLFLQKAFSSILQGKSRFHNIFSPQTIFYYKLKKNVFQSACMVPYRKFYSHTIIYCCRGNCWWLNVQGKIGLSWFEQEQIQFMPIFSLLVIPGIANRTQSNWISIELLKSNEIELNSWIEFNWVWQSNEIELTEKRKNQSNPIERSIFELVICVAGVENW